MIRPATISAMILVAGLGFGLFKVKYEVQSLEEELGKINRQIAADQDQIHVLKAEWSYMTQPVRLGEMAQRHLALKPLQSAQMGSFDQLPLRQDRAAIAQVDLPADPSVAAVLKAMQVASKPPVVRAGTFAAAKPRTEP